MGDVKTIIHLSITGLVVSGKGQRGKDVNVHMKWYLHVPSLTPAQKNE